MIKFGVLILFFFFNKVTVCRKYQEDGQVDQLHLILLPGGKPTNHSGQYGLHGIWLRWEERAIVPGAVASGCWQVIIKC